MPDIDFNTLIPHGRVVKNESSEELVVSSASSVTSYLYNLVGESYKHHYLELKDRYHVPFSIEMTVTLDNPSFILLIGGGHISFGSPRNSHKIEDIAKPTGKPAQDGWLYNDSFPMNREVTLKVTYNKKDMQIEIDGEERFYSQKLPYMKKANLEELNDAGIRLGIVVQKGVQLCIKKMSVTEYEEDTLLIHNPDWSVAIQAELDAQRNNTNKEKATYESVKAKLPIEFQEDLDKADMFCRSMKTMKMKRVVDKSGEKITYSAPDYGISYVFHIFDHQWSANFSWYIVTAGTADTWHRKADYMDEALIETAKYDKPLAERIFNLMNDCVCCYPNGCLASTLYQYDGRKRLVCHGIVLLRQKHEDFNDTLEFFKYTDQLLTRKKEEGTLQTEKIFLMK